MRERVRTDDACRVVYGLTRLRVDDAVEGKGDIAEFRLLQSLILRAVLAAVGVKLDADKLCQFGLDFGARENVFLVQSAVCAGVAREVYQKRLAFGLRLGQRGIIIRQPGQAIRSGLSRRHNPQAAGTRLNRA